MGLNMHNYSITNTKIRITAVSVIAIVAAYSTFALNPVISLLPEELQPLSPFAVFGALFFIFDKWAWKLCSLNKLLEIPNFSGTWKGNGHSTSQKTNNGKFEVIIKVKQTFTQLIVDAKFNSSCSESFVANVDSINPLRAKLVYSYLNKPDGNAVKTQNEHFGTVELFCTKKNELSGNYFTNREPQTKGKLELKKVKDNDFC